MKRLFDSDFFQPRPQYDAASSDSGNYGYAQSGEPMTWDQLVVQPLEKMAMEAVRFLPDLIAAVITLVIGWVIARIAGVVVSKFLKSVKFDSFADKLGLTGLLEQDGKKTAPHQWCGQLTFWLVMLFAVISSLGQLNFHLASRRLDEFYFFVVTVLTTLTIFILGIFLSFLCAKIVHTVTHKLSVPKPEFYANITKWTVLVFTFLISLTQIGMPPQVVLIVLGVAYITLCITFIVAFGAGGTAWAAKLLDRTLERKS